MGRALCDAFPAARAVLDEVDDALGEPLSALIFEGPLDRLTLTANAQPASWRPRLPPSGRWRPSWVGVCPSWSALSPGTVGEYTALAAAGAIGLSDAARLLRLRGTAMQEAVAPGAGAMAAILGADLPTVEAVCEPRPKAACASSLTTMARDSR